MWKQTLLLTIKHIAKKKIIDLYYNFKYERGYTGQALKFSEL